MANRQSQKRSRSPECEECLPISKRINRLQIENDRRQSEEEKTVDLQSNQSPDLSSIQSSSSRQQNLSMNPCQECAGNNNLPYDIVQGYNPELTNRDNPEYYRINSMLFKAHYERVLRHKDTLQYPDT
ncbi:uncharacterized protein LOC127707466 [Mytilus californianus]|uniref:uncharacterized protein LOC127707466 n=1 Tax=Mytilus californianus TaxID=6549 RepID=UPI0022480733|nr:uncharacterized protein LOC127707466 [Mytilus californianus]